MAVALNRDHTSDRRCVLVNDIDGCVVNFFKILRDRPDELIWRICLTPQARDEWQAATEKDGDLDFIKSDPVEAARLFFVAVNQSFSNIRGGRSGWGYGGMKDQLNKRAKRLGDVAAALMDMQFENRDAFELIRRHARPRVMLYLDPPYCATTRKTDNCYQHDGFTDSDHEQLAEQIKETDAWVALSGYDNEIYNDILSRWGKHEQHTRSATHNQRAAAYRKECVWLNYRPNYRPVKSPSSRQIR